MESRSDVNDLHATIFQVESVDGNGVRHRSGRLEVTDTTLVFHSKNKTAIRWPLRCLRRYGFDGDKFHFESGRRCTTGPGIYSYRCRRAEELFNMLQLKIKRIAELSNPDYLNPIVVSPNNRHRSNSIVLPHHNHTLLVEDLPLGTGMAVIQRENTFGINSPVVSPHTPISPPNGSLYMNNMVLANGNLNDMERSESLPPPMATLEDIRPEIANSVMMNHSDKTVSYVNYNERSASHASCHSERLPSISPLNSTVDGGRHLSLGGSADFHGISDSLVLGEGYLPESACPIYMNVGPENRRDLDRLYANTSVFDKKDMPMIPSRLSVSTGPLGSGSSYSCTLAGDVPHSDSSTINYITVDVDKGSDSSQVAPFSPIGSLNSGQPESPPTRPLSEGYATIDFERTEAITITAKFANRDNANGGRHNSTFSGSILFPQQNYSYPE